MAKIITAYVREMLRKLSDNEITFSRFVELLNEEAERFHDVRVKLPKHGQFCIVRGDETGDISFSYFFEGKFMTQKPVKFWREF